ncbi:MAG: ComEC/Rec2 family competence protein [Dongiaceae bacterium]
MRIALAQGVGSHIAAGAVLQGLAARLLAERDRWALWLPPFIGTGIGIYFLLPSEPPPWIGFVLVATGGFVCALARRHLAGLLVAIALTAMAIGFLAAQTRTAIVATPMLEADIGPVQVIGTVVAVEALPSGQRVLLENVVIEGLAPEATPNRVRIRVVKRDVVMTPGERIDLLAEIGPPSLPVTPDSFDFQRAAFFRRIGAQGFAYGGPRAVADTDAGLPHAAVLRAAIEGLRLGVAQRIRAVLPDAVGGVAIALMTGSQAAIPREAVEAMRAVGLAHLLSVSGLHIGLVTGILLLTIRAGLALFPAIALRYPIKKWAAAFAFAGAFFYLLVTGMGIPTQRSFLMAGLVLFAVVIDRTALSMRLVAWAAAVILILQPETLTSPSFQLSFAAVVALIAVYETSLTWRLRQRSRSEWWARLPYHLIGVAVTSLVAEAATTAFALYHFSQVTVFGLVANLVAVPVTATWIMPWAVAAYALMPFGVEAVALVPMGWGIEVVLETARTVAAWPASVSYLPAMPLWGAVLVAIGGLWWALWRGAWRLWGIAPIAAGFASIAFVVPPHILVSDDARLVAVAGENGELVFSQLRANRFEAEIWMHRAGQEERAAWPDDGYGADGRLLCDALGCLYRAEEKVVAIAWRAAALAEDCAVADLVVSLEPARDLCRGHERGDPIVIDRFDLWRNGGYAIWLSADDIRIRSVAETRGVRPWVADIARRRPALSD